MNNEAAKQLAPDPYVASRAAFVTQIVSELWGVSVADILSPRRPQSMVEARYSAMHVMRIVTKASFAQIGLAFGRDSSTVQHGIKAVRLRAYRDRELAKMLAYVVTRATAAVAAKG